MALFLVRGEVHLTPCLTLLEVHVGLEHGAGVGGGFSLRHLILQLLMQRGKVLADGGGVGG